MKIYTAIFLGLFSFPSLLYAAVPTIHVEGSPKKVIVDQPAASTGLNNIYIVYSLESLKVSATPSSGNPSSVVWMKYDSRGGGFAEAVPSHVEGDRSVLTTVEGNFGYIVEDGTDRAYFWLVDYSQNRFFIDSLVPGSEMDCQSTQLFYTGNAEPIEYYTINGRQMELSREIGVEYSTLQFSEDSFSYSKVNASETLESASDGVIRVPASLCETSYTLSGDRFLKQWGEDQTVTTSAIFPVAVEARTKAEQQGETPDNQSGGSTGGLGGSAPAEIKFEAAVSDAALFYEWQFSTYADFDDITDRYSELSLNYIFDEVGTTYIRFVADNADGTCLYIGDTYEVTIGESSLKCPNAFTPGSTEGVNDIWKVSFRSIVSFECHIFNRWGKQMASFTNPADGWDGKYGGKVVPTGVYYYVIKAVGADGKKYDLSGDINILNYK
ncbi:MAG: gliding motility-associated C-terminal domain-containing protein [Muribaculaceae bacterium]|nr:gliding motility-associated C-terminal domain-containing protein [Muribaculaceae bacterium]